MIYTVHVTQEDIDNGGSTSSDCPIALAVHRQVPGLERAYVGIHAIFDHDKGQFVYMSQATHDWRLRYDSTFHSGKKVKPFSFEIEV